MTDDIPMIELADRAAVGTAFALLRGQDPDAFVPILLHAHYHHPLPGIGRAALAIARGNKPEAKVMQAAVLEVVASRLEFTIATMEALGGTSLSLEALAGVNKIIVESILGKQA